MTPHRFLLRIVVAFWLGIIGGLLVAPLVDASTGIDGGTNALRAEAGLAPLETSALLTDLAARRAAELYPPESGFHHAYWWVDKVGCWDGAGENIAYRIPAPDDPDSHFVGRWYDSAPHRANMLGDFTLTGSAVFLAPDGGAYAVQLFLKPCQPDPAPAPAQAPQAPPPPAPATPAPVVLPDTAIQEPFFPGFIPLSVFIGASGLLLAYEFWTLATGRPPITRLTRDFQRNHPHIAGLMLLAIGILFGHLFWP